MEEPALSRIRRARERLGALWPHRAELPPAARRSVREALRELSRAARELETHWRDDAPTLGPVDDTAPLEAATLEATRLYRRARDALRLRDEVLALVSHDLRNPLNTISICVTLLADTLPRPARTRVVMRRLDLIRRSVAQMDQLIQDLLDAARAEAGRLELVPSELSPGPLLAGAVLTLRPLAAEKSQRLELDVADDVPLVRADRQRITQVVSNLVGNAIKFTPPGGRITVRARRIPAGALICVEDSGSGIAPEDLPHIFDRFWHAQRERRAGAGLGLAIARGIVEAHGGRIWAESSPGRGAKLCFTLPAARRGRREQPMRAPAAARAAVRRGIDAPDSGP
ncbi:MAG TPA: HAMP domain-containing sensor histidine kinase [Longimicrobiales bacterium]